MEKLKRIQTGKQVPGFSNYSVLPNGTVYNEKKKRYQTIRKIKSSNRTYHTVVISQGGTAKQFYIHKLVGEVFVKNPKPNEYDVVLHIDENTENNHKDNLKWGTQQQACKIGKTGEKAKAA